MPGLAAMTVVPPEPARLRARAMQLRAVASADRAPLEHFIRMRYAQTYGARIHSFLPELYALDDADGELAAVLGLRAAARGPLFLETYLDQPIEQVLAQAGGRPVSRHQVVEVGNLAGRTPGALRQLMPRMGDLLRHTGYRWLVFTGHARLINSFQRAGVSLLALAPARPERLDPAARADWGSYYDAAPVVMGVDIQTGRQQLLAHRDEQIDLGWSEP